MGGLSPHKNLPRLIEAFARGCDPTDVRLVLVGDIGRRLPHARPGAPRGGRAGSDWATASIFTGFVPDDDLAYLYNRAYALVQPSLMEGFGLPPVEAMACGNAGRVEHGGVAARGRRATPGSVFDPTGRRRDGPSPSAACVDEPALRAGAGGEGPAAVPARFTWACGRPSLLECFDGARGPTCSRRRRKSA